MNPLPHRKSWDAVVVGGGIAGLSAAIYLGRGRRTVFVVDENESLAHAATSVGNYLGFPDGIDGEELLERGRRQIGAVSNDVGEVIVDENRETNIAGLYAAGCVTAANCQMIIAAGDGAAAAQAINRSLFEESLESGSLEHYRTEDRSPG